MVRILLIVSIGLTTLSAHCLSQSSNSFGFTAEASPLSGDPCVGSIEWTSLGNGDDLGPNCSEYHCYRPEILEPQLTPQAGCDPAAGPCPITVEVRVSFPGNHLNDTTDTGGLFSFANVTVRNSAGAVYGSCGNGGQVLTDSEGTTSWGFTGTCGDSSARFELTASTCPSPLCPKNRTVAVDLSDSNLCPQPPKEECPGGAGDCRSCLFVGGGGAPAGGGGGGFGGSPGAPTGPGARLAYKAGGAGHPGWPGSDAWRPVLGRGWSHDYAQRIVETNNPSRVWLITPWATYREFRGLSGGTYTVASPSDEHRTLRLEASGWSLTDLDGRVTLFDAAGRWLSSADRFGNAKTATYGAAGELERVDFPDGRHELFTYEPGGSLPGGPGKLASITEVGVDGTTSRTWSYTWVGDDLDRIDLPDGRAYDFFYGDVVHPGYLTRVELVGTDGGRRVEAAWAYDARGNVIDLWRGDNNPTGPDAVDRWQLSFDDAELPEVTTVTDPLGDIATYTFARDPGRGSSGVGSRKPRLENLSGSCATCGLAPNAVLTYADNQNPLLPTRELDGRGIATVYTYTDYGQIESRTEADGVPALQRITSWAYDSAFPALVSQIQQPSTSGSAAGRVTTWSYDASGALIGREIQGSEDPGGAFQLLTVYTPTPEGVTTVVDPPGYAATDQTVTTYDPARGGLLPATRSDPLIGTTTFGYDPFNRRTSTTDPNGVTASMTYDLGDRVTVSTHEGATPAEDLVTEHRYTEFGQLHQTILPRGNVIEYAYDATGRLTSVERKADLVTPGERVVYSLDAVGNRTREEHQRWDADLGAWEPRSWTDTVWQSRCHRESTHHADGTCTAYDYDCEGQLEKTWDANHCTPSLVGALAGASLSGTGSGPPTTEYAYDELNRLTAVTQPWGGAGGGFATTSYTYDVQDHLASVTDAEGNVTTYATGDRDLLTREESPVSGITTHAYNDHGELITSTDARGVRTDRVLDALDRVTQTSYVLPDPSDLPDPAPLTTTYVYDDPAIPFSKGRLTAINRPDTTVDYAYDRFGRLTRDGDLNYSYDPNGNRQTIGYPGDMTAVYTFDPADRHQSLVLQRPGEPDQTIASAARYEPSGPLTELELGNGLIETRTYTPRYFPESIRVEPATEAGSGSGSADGDLEGTALFHWTYTTDAVGNPLTIADLLDPARDKTYAYQPYQYFLTLGNGPWGYLSWTYDRIGNRLTETRDGATDVYSYAPNAGNDGNTAILAAITPAGVGLRTYTYGPAGHLEEVALPANPIDFQNNAAGRLSRIERPAGDAAVDFTYDGRSFLRYARASALSEIFSDGFETGEIGCWARVVGGNENDKPSPCGQIVAATSLYSSSGSLQTVISKNDLDQQSVDQTLLYFSADPLFELNSLGDGTEADIWWVRDHLGSQVQAVDTFGVIRSTKIMEPFGEYQAPTEGPEIDLIFPGQWISESWEEASSGVGLVHNVHRWYLADLGNFNRVDPIGLVRSYFDLVGYAGRRPTVAVDRYGLTTCVMISAQSLFGFGESVFAVGDHAALFMKEPCAGEVERCEAPRPLLYDPAGGYSLQFSDAGTSQVLNRYIPNWSLQDYFNYHCDSGSDFIEVYCFPTTCCEEEQIYKNMVPAGPAGCALSVSGALRGIGPFKGLRQTIPPARLRDAVNELLKRHTGGGASNFTHSCSR